MSQYYYENSFDLTDSLKGFPGPPVGVILTKSAVQTDKGEKSKDTLETDNQLRKAN